MKMKKIKIFKNIFSNHQVFWWFESYTALERRASL